LALNLKDPSLLKQFGYIDGGWIASSSGKRFPVSDPANGQRLADVADCGLEETRRAIGSASKALPGWRAKTAKERAAVLRRWFDLMISNTEDLAQILTAEQGKPLAEARGEIAYGASFIEWFAEEGKRLYGDVIPTVAADRRLLTLRQPIGVCAAITPWNFPNAMITRKVGPALAAGCTIVLKPAEATPLSALAMVELGERAGLPAGVFNVVTGLDAAAIGLEMCTNPSVRKLSFTRSTEVGRILLRQSADTVKKLSLELGGNAPFIVFDDADIDAAVEGAIVSKYRNAGQTCVCANRIYVQDSVYDAFASRLAAKVQAMRVGAGTEEGVTIGPLIEEAAVAKVKEHVADARSKGARILVGGEPHSLGGLFFQPTVLTEVTGQMRIASEETFGPVAPLFRFRTEEEVIGMANDTEFGLASYFYSRDIGRIFRVAEAIETGMVCVNSGLLSNEVVPFGGIKQSGLGREGGRQGIEDYVETKYLCLGGI
jgi:succinate-semialdehyde dehydrogenase / glutarate-semialdehyde dehydrogenase